MMRNFTVCQTSWKFSSIALDQAHEQNNASVKGDGGAAGLFHSSESLLKWMVSGLEMARIISEFESAVAQSGKSPQINLHHEQTKGTQERFLKNMNSLIATLRDMGNPFLEDGKDLLRLDTKDIMAL
jgi:hypothetical protein